MIQILKRTIEKAFDCRIYRKSLPVGTDLFYDLERAFGLTNFCTVFDVGANSGQSATTYLKHFSASTIYSFEPTQQPFVELNHLAKNSSRLLAYNCGMGKSRENITINVNPVSRTNSIYHARPGDLLEQIKINTIDNFCTDNNISEIDFLKIDTEGYELEVLAGADLLLKNQSIKLLFLECEPIPVSNYFVPFTNIVNFLSDYPYELFGIYEQTRHWDGKKKYFIL